MRKATVERMATPLVVSGALLFPASLAIHLARPFQPHVHALLLYGAGFLLYCSGVAGNLVASLRKGVPRPLWELAPLGLVPLLVATSVIMALLGPRGGASTFLYPLVAAHLAMVLHSLLQTRGIVPPYKRGAALLPWLLGPLAGTVVLLRGGSVIEGLMTLALVTSATLVASVSAGFLSFTYGGPSWALFYVGSLLLFASASLGLGGEILSASLLLLVLSTGFWKRPGSRKLGFWWAQVSAALGAFALLIVSFLGFGMGGFVVMHALLLGSVYPMVLGQSIYLAPVVIASRSGVYPPGWVFLLGVPIGVLRALAPVASGVLALALLVLVLVFLRPRPRWVWLVLRYGTVVGYERVYRERRGPQHGFGS